MPKLGKIAVAVGPMFSGKTEWLVSKLRAHEIAKDKILAIRHKLDDRYHQENITSHNDSSFDAKAIIDISELKNLIAEIPNLEVLGIDEIQFFKPELADYLLELQKKGITVYGAGLDLDFAGEPWETSMKVMAYADRIEKLTAVCSVCNLVSATRTQRLITGGPAPKSGSKILIGGKESYTARCILHHEIV